MEKEMDLYKMTLTPNSTGLALDNMGPKPRLKTNVSSYSYSHHGI